MVRKLVVVFTSVVLFAAAHAKALGLGEIVLDSALNQPLNAQIALLQLGDVRPEQISMQIADASDFARFSIERENFLNSIEFNIQSRGLNTFVQLSTAEAVREPYLSFVLETRWPSGRLLSEHTLLLDLPAFAPTGAVPAIEQAVQSNDASQQFIQNQSIATQSSSSTASSPARFAAPAEPPEPEAVAETPAQASAAAAPAVVPATAPRNANVDETVTIGTQDTLWDIALQVRPDSSVSVQQTMLALQSMNREAFIADNINMVRRGQVLRVPTLEQIRTLSAREAMSEVARQNQLFDNRRNVPLASQPLTAQPQNTPATAPTRGELSVVSVDNAGATDAASGSGAQSAELDARIASLEDALAVQREEADRAARVNAELTARLGLLEEQINSAQEIIRLRDLELAQLQQALEQTAVAEPAPVDPPVVITMAPEKTLVEQILDTLVANTYALIALIGLIILMLVFVLLRRNRTADQAALAGIDGMEVDADDGSASEDDDKEIPDGDSAINANLSGDELDEIMSIAGTADAELLSDDMDLDVKDEIVSEELAEIELDEEKYDDEYEDGPGLRPAPLADPQASKTSVDVLEEAEALIAYERFDDAEEMLRDAVVAESDRVDLRMKLLEVFVAKQDAVGFKLQETEIRDMGARNVEPRIATLREQLLSDTDSEILEDGEEDFFDELNELDDMELALDLEASAEVDDSKVLAGAPSPAADDSESALSSNDSEQDDASNDINFDFAPDEDEQSTGENIADEAEEDDSIELGFSSPQAGAPIEDFDESEDEAKDLSAEFDLSDNDEEFISFEAEDSAPPPAESAAEPVEFEVDDDNAIEFDFAGSDSDDADKPASAPAPATASDESAAEYEAGTSNDVDFDFALMDDEEADEAPTEKTKAAPESEVADIEFDVDDAEDAEIEFELDEADDMEIEFLDDDDSSFDDNSLDFVTDADADVSQKQGAAPEAPPEFAPTEDVVFDEQSFAGDSTDTTSELLEDEDDDSDDDDFDFLSDADEAATKLDLARAYFEMDDHEGAREILKEVQKEGNEEQIKDATELLKKL